jgi:hypothetical protein
MANSLAKQLITEFDPNLPYGFKGIDGNGHPIDSLDLLTGTVGILLTLLASSTPIVPEWDEMTGIS